MTSRTDGWGFSGQTVLTTVNAGLTWHEASPPEPIPVGSTATPYGAFLDKKTAWIIYAINGHINPEASVWHTTDSGKTWTPGAPLNHQVYGDKLWAEFAVLDSQSIWLMVRGVSAEVGSQYNHRLYRSMDGGLTWNFLSSELSDDYTGMAFADAIFGLRTLQTTGAYAAAPPVYEITEDGGATWKKRELPPPPGDPSLFNSFVNCETYQPVSTFLPVLYDAGWVVLTISTRTNNSRDISTPVKMAVLPGCSESCRPRPEQKPASWLILTRRISLYSTRIHSRAGMMV